MLLFIKINGNSIILYFYNNFKAVFEKIAAIDQIQFSAQAKPNI